MSASSWVAFVLAAALGASLRFLVSGAVADRTDRAVPLGTLLVNASGSLLSGFVTGRSVVLASGFCGAYTTFSTFTYETVRLMEEGDMGHAFANVGATLATCALAAAAGMALGAAI
jgi:CrcB protein